jgi:hypothetical protein
VIFRGGRRSSAHLEQPLEEISRPGFTAQTVTPSRTWTPVTIMGKVTLTYIRGRGRPVVVPLPPRIGVMADHGETVIHLSPETAGDSQEI